MAKQLKKVTLAQVLEMARDDRDFFNAFLKNPESALRKRGLVLSSKESQMARDTTDMCVFTLVDVVRKLRQRGWTWPDKPWREWP